MKYLITLITVFSFLIVNGQNWNQLGLDIDGEALGDESGDSSTVSMNAAGDRVAIGAYNNDGNGNNAGHVRVYEWSGTDWVQLGLDIDGEAAEDNSGSVSMNATGDRLAIGANRNDGNGNNAGHVRVFEWSGVAWVQLGLDIDGEAAWEGSGRSVSMNATGNRVTISAGDLVRVFEWSGTAWVKLGDITSSSQVYNGFGESVSMNSSGNRVAIGAPRDNSNAFLAGNVSIYEYTGTSWVQLGLDINGEAAYDHFGTSVSMNGNGNIVAIGATHNNYWNGHVRVYEWSGTAWVQLGLDIDGEFISGGIPGKFGWTVSLNTAGDRVAIGAKQNSGNGLSSGHVRIYEWSGTSWVQLGLDIDGEAAYDHSGIASINAAGNRVAIGAHGNDGSGNWAGHVRVYEFISTNNIQIENEFNTIKTYPNPFSTSTTINLPSEPHIMTIYDILGNKVREEQVNGTTIIERRDLTKGLYLIEVKSENQNYSGKIVVD
tara:strand:- start:457 stop:1917 length:1461 start_codon:yes stop_codon:yes gene_type:complete